MTAPAAGQASLSQVDQGRVALAGEVTAVSVLALRTEGERQILAARDAGQPRLTLDLAGLATASSIVLSLLLCWQRLAQAEGVILTFSGTSERLRSLASLSGLEEALLGPAEPSLP